MVEAIPQVHVYYLEVRFIQSLVLYSISKLYTLGDNYELTGVYKGFTKVQASVVIIVLL